MDSLANYDSDGENSNNSVDIKMPNIEKYNTTQERRASDVNYDPVQMDMSEDSNNNNSSGDASSDGTRSPPVSHQSSTTSKSDATRTPPRDQRRSDHDNNTSHSRGESKRSERNDRTRTGDDKCRRTSNDNKRHRDSDNKDAKRPRDDERKSRDDDRRRDRNSSSSSRDDRKDDRDRKDKDHHHHHHRDDRRERRRDDDRRHSTSDRTRRKLHKAERVEEHRKTSDRLRSRSKSKERLRSRSRSKERAPLPFRPMTYREEKSRNKLAQLEKLGIELKAPEGTIATPVLLGEQNYYNPSTTASHGKYAEQIQKRKLLWANKSKQEDKKVATAVVEPTASTWVGTTFTHDQDGKMTAKFKRLMGIKGDVPAVPPPGQKPDILKKQEEMFSNMEQQYEVARATTHTQRGVGLGYASSGYQFPR